MNEVKLPDDVLVELEALRKIVLVSDCEPRRPGDMDDNQIALFFNVHPETARVKIRMSGLYDRLAVWDTEKNCKVKVWRKKT